METIYLVTIDDVCDTDASITHIAFSIEELAIAHLSKVRDNFIKEITNFKDYSIYADDDYAFDVGIDGFYNTDHYCVYIEKIEVSNQ